MTVSERADQPGEAATTAGGQCVRFCLFSLGLSQPFNERICHGVQIGCGRDSGGQQQRSESQEKKERGLFYSRRTDALEAGEGCYLGLRTRP